MLVESVRVFSLLPILLFVLILSSFELLLSLAAAEYEVVLVENNVGEISIEEDRGLIMGSIISDVAVANSDNRLAISLVNGNN